MKPISLLNVPICTQGMQRTWWPEVGMRTIIITGPYHNNVRVVKRGHQAYDLSYLLSLSLSVAPGACPTSDISIELEIQPKFSMLSINLYSTDHNEFSLWSVEHILN